MATVPVSTFVFTAERKRAWTWGSEPPAEEGRAEGARGWAMQPQGGASPPLREAPPVTVTLHGVKAGVGRRQAGGLGCLHWP